VKREFRQVEGKNVFTTRVPLVDFKFPDGIRCLRAGDARSRCKIKVMTSSDEAQTRFRPAVATRGRAARMPWYDHEQIALAH
jgi:hypothetical protein